MQTVTIKYKYLKVKMLLTFCY